MPVNADGLTWGAAPQVLPKGAQIAVLSGDPSKDGLYVLRLKMPGELQEDSSPQSSDVGIRDRYFRKVPYPEWVTNLTGRRGSNSALASFW